MFAPSINCRHAAILELCYAVLMTEITKVYPTFLELDDMAPGTVEAGPGTVEKRGGCQMLSGCYLWFLELRRAKCYKMLV